MGCASKQAAWKMPAKCPGYKQSYIVHVNLREWDKWSFLNGADPFLGLISRGWKDHPNRTCGALWLLTGNAVLP